MFVCTSIQNHTIYINLYSILQKSVYTYHIYIYICKCGPWKGQRQKARKSHFALMSSCVYPTRFRPRHCIRASYALVGRPSIETPPKATSCMKKQKHRQESSMHLTSHLQNLVRAYVSLRNLGNLSRPFFVARHYLLRHQNDMEKPYIFAAGRPK